MRDHVVFPPALLDNADPSAPEQPDKKGRAHVPSAEHTVTINRPAAEVFDYLADGTHNPEWRSGVLEISRTSTSGGSGASYRQVLSGPGGRRIDGDYRVTDYQPPHRLGFQVTAGPARPSGVFEITEQSPTSSRVRFALDLRPRGFMILMTPMISAQVRREVAALDTLKAVLERGSPA
jgi:uncharacterized protein YndB with AHSA1/START domain